MWCPLEGCLGKITKKTCDKCGFQPHLFEKSVKKTLVENPAVSTILRDLDPVLELASDMTGSMSVGERDREQERITRVRTEVPKMLRRLQTLEGALKRASK